MSAEGLICRGCGKQHNKTKWPYAEKVFRLSLGLKGIPAEALGTHRVGPFFSFNLFSSSTARSRCGELLGITWKDYQFFVHRQSHLVNPKGKLGIANYSKNGKRSEVDMDRADRFYFDCDSAGTWEKLKRVLKKAGIPAFFHESSSSVRKRVEGDYSLPLKWHCEIPLSKTLPNPLDDLDPKSPEARYARSEWKKKYYHVVAVLSSLAGFKGVGQPSGQKVEKACGFDATTSQMCQIRFLGARQHEGGTVPCMDFLEGNNALDWDMLLLATNYEAGQRITDPGVRRVVMESPEGPREFQVQGAGDQLDSDIRDRISVRQFMASFCGYGAPHSGTSHYCCPMHYETENKRSMHVYDADVLGGNEMWHCFGDCHTSGDVVRMAQLYWGCTRREARNRLASHVGLDPDVYRPQFRVPLGGTPAPAPAPVAPEAPLTTGKKKRIPKKAPTGLYHTSEWAKKWGPTYGDTEGFTRAMTKVMIECQAGATTNKKGDKVADLLVIASTLWQATGDYYRKYDSLLASVVETYGRIKEKKPAIGRGKLRERLHTQGMFELSKALGRDGADFRESLKILVGFGLTRGAEKDWLDGLHKWFLDHPTEPGSDAEKQEEEDKKWERQYTRFMNALRRPGGCKQCYQIVRGEGGRHLGPDGADGEATPLKRNLVCRAKPCLYCFLLQAVSEIELLDELWGDRAEEPGLGEEGIFVVEAIGIEHMKYLSTIKDEVSKDPDAKLGVTGWGDDGAPTLSYFVTSQEAAVVVRSAIISGGLLAYGKRIDVTYRKFKSTREAIDAAAEARISFNVRVKRLIEERDAMGVCEWLWWGIYKTAVRNSRSEKALPWPTKEQIQAQVKTKNGEEFVPDLYPGEPVTFDLHHAATGYFLARRKKIPFTLDQAMDAMASNHGLHEVLAAGGAARSA